MLPLWLKKYQMAMRITVILDYSRPGRYLKQKNRQKNILVTRLVNEPAQSIILYGANLPD